MKMVRKGAALVAAMLLLAGCSAETPNYPVMEPMDASGLTLETAQDSSVKVSYPADTWTDVEMEPLTLFYTATMGSEGQACNVNVTPVAPASGDLTDADREYILSSLGQDAEYITVGVSEMRLLYNKPVIYNETTMQFTDETIDLMLDSGTLTEEQIEAIGGREVLLAIPPTNQVCLVAVADNYIYAYIGTYHGEEQKDVMLDLMTLLVANTEQVR